MTRRPAPAGSALGLHRVLDPPGVLPQAAWRLDDRPDIWPDEARLRVERLNLDAASYRQLRDAYAGPGETVRAGELRAEVLRIIRQRGKMHNPVTDSGGMLVGVVEEVGRDSPLGLRPGERVATLVSLTLTPLRITDGLRDWDGRTEQVPAEGHAILFGRSVAAPLPADLPLPVAMAVLDVCGAAATTTRVVRQYAERSRSPTVAVLGAAGKSGSLALAAARQAGAGRRVGLVPDRLDAAALERAALATDVVVADARDPVGVWAAMQAAGGPADVTVVCVDVPGCEHGAILATAEGGTVVFFSMATSFSAAALGAEGLAADVAMLIGNGYAPGHARLALDLLRADDGLRTLVERRVAPQAVPGGRLAP
jgi:L-erythro-3,5-diaminohexanoate dehydrogenase